MSGASTTGSSSAADIKAAAAQSFLKDIQAHKLRIILDQGTHRHLYAGEPGSSDMHFNIVTWPGYLAYSGDMGNFVFERLPDMFEFFRSDDGRGPNLPYWAEKVQAADRHDGVTEFCPAQFRSQVKDYFDHWAKDQRDEDAGQDKPEWPQERLDELWSEIEGEVLSAADDHWGDRALIALHDFNFDGFRFEDWERSCERFSDRFVWACHAIQWAITQYDLERSKQSQSEPDASAALATPATPIAMTATAEDASVVADRLIWLQQQPYETWKRIGYLGCPQDQNEAIDAERLSSPQDPARARQPGG